MPSSSSLPFHLPPHSLTQTSCRLRAACSTCTPGLSFVLVRSILLLPLLSTPQATLVLTTSTSHARAHRLSTPCVVLCSSLLHPWPNKSHPVLNCTYSSSVGACLSHGGRLGMTSCISNMPMTHTWWARRSRSGQGQERSLWSCSDLRRAHIATTRQSAHTAAHQVTMPLVQAIACNTVEHATDVEASRITPERWSSMAAHRRWCLGCPAPLAASMDPELNLWVVATIAL
jgi:hypothetical protein